MTEAIVREEQSGDHAAVARVVEAAFGRPDEARLVEALRPAVAPQVSLVAVRGESVVGHVFFSPVTIDGAPGAPPVAGLAPLAVAPDEQGRGVGGALVRAGLAAAAERGWQAVFLLGDPAYYGRFGFSLSAPRGLRYESEAFDTAFQLLELVPGSLAGQRGWVRYPAAFGASG